MFPGKKLALSAKKKHFSLEEKLEVESHAELFHDTTIFCWKELGVVFLFDFFLEKLEIHDGVWEEVKAARSAALNF